MASITKKIIGQYMDLIIKTDITLVNQLPLLSYSVDHKEMEQLSRKRLGKTILFTDNHSWTDEEIILAYYSPN